MNRDLITPGEWAPQDAVMLTWPSPDGDFSHQFEAVEACFAGIVKAITAFEPVHINVPVDQGSVAARLDALGVDQKRYRLIEVEADDVWCRDHGPITVMRHQRRVLLDFTFNGWGGKFEAARDNRINRELAARGALPAPLETIDFVLEGGSIESDGEGTLLTTERCLLAPTRNPGLDRAGIEALLSERLGFDRFLWLRHGDLLGDDTDGHIDTLARFCDAGTVAFQDCSDASDPHFELLQAMARELKQFRRRDGSPYQLIGLPLPDPIHDADGKRLPAGYANFLIINGAVLVPVYGVAQDRDALEMLRPAFPGRQVLGVDCRALIEQYGSLHCVTMQIPSEPGS